MDHDLGIIEDSFSEKHSSSLKKNMSSIPLSTLNPVVRERVQKWDVTGDGELDIHEAMSAIITLQKQSNNYKKTLYIIMGVLAITLCCMFGINVLAIQITKDIKSSSIEGNIPVLKTTSGETFSVLNTLEHSQFSDFQEKQSSDLDLMPQFIQIDALKMKASGIFHTENATYTFTDYGTIVSDVNEGLSFHPFSGFVNDKFIQEVTRYVNVVKSLDVQARVNATIQMFESMSKEAMMKLDAELEEKSVSMKLKSENAAQLVRLTDSDLYKKVVDLEAKLKAAEKPCNDAYSKCRKSSSANKCGNQLKACLSNNQLYVSYQTQLKNIMSQWKSFCIQTYDPWEVVKCSPGQVVQPCDAVCSKCMKDFDRDFYWVCGGPF